MAPSPSKEADVETEEQSPDNNRQTMGSDDERPDPDNQYMDMDVKEQDRWLPIANVARIMKSALPDNAKIAKEAKECMQECVSEFISFITSEASEKCQQEKRKTVNGEDILFAMTSLGFENYAEALKIYLTKFREQSNRPENSGRPNSSYGSGDPSGSGAGQSVNAGDSNLIAAQLNDQPQEGNPYGNIFPSGNNGTGGNY